MEKSKKLQLYCYTHKVPEYGLVDDSIHTPIHVGKELSQEQVCEVGDNTGDNISKLNPIFRELTGMYWVWKNVHDVKYVGSEHYRRRWGLKLSDVETLLKKYKIIIFKPNHLGQQTLMHNYVMCHSFIDFATTEYLVKSMYPEYADDWNKFITYGHDLIMANCFICEKEEYDKACEFVFNILNAFVNAFGLASYERMQQHVKMFSQKACPPDKQKIGWDWQKYQLGVCGFLAERLFTLYIYHNFKNKIYEANMVEMEKL